MTEQEAEVLRVRLTRIWSPEPWEEPELQEEHLFLGWYASYEFHPILSFTIADGVFFHAEVKRDHTLYTLVYNPGPVLGFEDEGFEGAKGMLSCHSQQGAIKTDEVADSKEQSQFIAQYLDFFRRGCWLSGCDIEASAHEKAEWIRGFTSEELESWNLKI